MTGKREMTDEQMVKSKRGLLGWLEMMGLPGWVLKGGPSLYA